MSKLFLVPTPIGNLKDITLRALEVLREVDFILAEDTRKAAILLRHFEIDKHTVSHHQFNEHQSLTKIIDLLLSGKNVALTTDAGTPGISDPGFLLVRECIRNNIEVECLPGPTAFVPALVNSGLPSDRFIFYGFLPPKKGRSTALTELKSVRYTMVFYESPFRLVKTLEELAENLGFDRQACVSRELSKIYEENIRGPLLDLITHYRQHPPKGECVIIVAGN